MNSTEVSLSKHNLLFAGSNSHLTIGDSVYKYQVVKQRGWTGVMGGRKTYTPTEEERARDKNKSRRRRLHKSM